MQPIRPWLLGLLCLLIVPIVPFSALPALAAPAAEFATVVPGRTLAFPADLGAHPAFRTEWWYATGWLQGEDGRPLGFQITFFRSATGHGKGNPSRFAPGQLIVAHAALSDPDAGKLLHEQKSAREGFGLAYAKVGDTDVKLDQWRFVREPDGHYRASIPGREIALELTLAPTQPLLLQGERGYSRKGPEPRQASYYYSEPQLKVTGNVSRHGKRSDVTGSAWLDHEWSSTVLASNATGWDWVGVNLDDGGALMAFQIRQADGSRVWSHAMLRDASGKITHFSPEEVEFTPQRMWRSPRTGVSYPVAAQLRTGTLRWEIAPLQDDQELDSRTSTGAIYWEGAATFSRDGKPAGRGYLELTGYDKPMKL